MKTSYKPNLRGTEVARGLVITHGAHTEKDEQQPKDTGNLTTFYHGLGLTDRRSGNKCSTWWGSRERRAGGEKAREGRPTAQGRLTRVHTV